VAEQDVLVFLLSLAVLLAAARALGEIARALGLPLVVGEIVTGILFGPTLLGRVWPSAFAFLFPTSGGARTMLGGYTTVAVILLLVVAGIDVDLRVVRRRGRSALLTSVLGMILPLVGGVVLALVLPDSDLVEGTRRGVFAAFVGVAFAISALPVIAKTLLDLGLFKTDIGLMVMASAMVDDLAGWLAFSVLVGPMRGGALDWIGLAVTVALTAVFVAACLVVGRPTIDRLLARFEVQPHTAPGRVLSVVIVFALLAASATHALGIHAIFGAFIIGVTVGAAKRLTERTRVVIEDFVMNIFAPVFFASLGLRVDFVRAFDLRLCVLVFLVASATKIIGCTIGARAGGFKPREALAVGFGLNARGAMEIILALLALDAGVIKPELFVALVVMALATSLLSGPVMKALLYREEAEENVVALLRRGAYVGELRAGTSSEAIDELVRALGSLLAGFKRDARESVLDRESTAPTGLGDEVAIPHAAIEGLTRPLLALGRAPHGIDFDAPDGRPAKIVFLLLMPPKAYEEEVHILGSIARAVYDERARTDLLAARSFDDVLRILGKSARRIAESRRPPAKPAGDSGL
jgi:Kef-type K+ transport system membrane component KefB/mannitol/fructose-specific phosphotransferase system IIA component (Ntr-type)